VNRGVGCEDRMDGVIEHCAKIALIH
jgi:hypothetical protein